MGPRPYSERSSLPTDAPNSTISAEAVPTQVMAESPSPTTLSAATTPSPVPQEVILVEPSIPDRVEVADEIQEAVASGINPFFPQPGDGMPYDHALPDFIRQVTDQQNLTALHSLSIRVISRMTSLHRMALYTPNLRELNLEGSLLGSLRDIGCNLKYLQVLKVGRCQLDSLDGTFGLSSLRELYAQRNLITDISPCANLPHIRHIDVSQNRICQVSYAGFLSMCNKLRSITFTGNPGVDMAGYRPYVRKIVPQLEILDGTPFLNEDNSEDNRFRDSGPDLIENYAEMSDSSSVDFDNITPRSASDSLTNLLVEGEGGEKEGWEIVGGFKEDATDAEVQEVLKEEAASLENDFARMSIKTEKNRLLEQAKMDENRNTNLKMLCLEKSTSVQKMDKDIENRSKKSNLFLECSLDVDDWGPPKEAPLQLSDPRMRRYRESVEIKEPLYDLLEVESEPILSSKGNAVVRLKRPSTAAGARQKSSLVEEARGEETGGVRRRPSSAVTTSTLQLQTAQTDQFTSPELGLSKLTSGVPVCGNLAAALRSRKKHQTAWEDDQRNREPEARNELSSRCGDTKEGRLGPSSGREVGLLAETTGQHGGGDSASREEHVVGEDVLELSEKWRKTFRRYRSNNRARWEEEDNLDYSNILGDLTES